MGGIKRLSVAVVVNYRKVTDEKGVTSAKPLSEAEKTQITDLVKEAMGFSRERGDSLNVVNSAFTDMERELIPELPLWQQPEMIELASRLQRLLLIGALIRISGAGRVGPHVEAHESAGRRTPPSTPCEQRDDSVPHVIPATKQATANFPA